jgi:hypothetical protein
MIELLLEHGSTRRGDLAEIHEPAELGSTCPITHTSMRYE